MQKTKIEWCDSTWNPVTGCLHNCPYCYAKGIAMRFGGVSMPDNDGIDFREVCKTGLNRVLDEPIVGANGKVAPYPFYFEPTLHRYRLDDLKEKKYGKNIFIGSTADLFGQWVPDSWIEAVFKACEESPEHRYLFLTKNPQRYYELGQQDKLPRGENFWYGTTADSPDDPVFFSQVHNTFVSIEPIMKPFGERGGDLPELIDWVILGAETGNRKGKVVPERSWIEGVVKAFQEAGRPIFMKDSMKPVWGEDIINQLPWKD